MAGNSGDHPPSQGITDFQFLKFDKMQQVIKVSIGNMAFTLEQDAHELMQDYLERLEVHYESSPNCREILSEIESRIAELLTERGFRDRIVPPEAIQEVIDILGRPEDFDTETENGMKDRRKKRVYRDPENKIAGGVCSGLGAFFSVDPLVFRIAFATWVLFFMWTEIFFDWGWGMSVLGMFAYIVLWISMPEARTVEQRCNMRGGSMSLKDIQKTVETEARNVSSRVGKGVREGFRSTGGFWKAFGRCFVIFIGAILFLTGMAGCASAVLAAFGIGIWNGLHAFGASWLLSIITDTPAWATVLIQILACIVVILPFTGMLYGGILLLFNLKAPRWKPGLINFIVWVISLLSLIGLSLGSLSAIRSIDHNIRRTDLPAMDTLFIEFSGCTAWKDSDVLVEADRDSYTLMYMNDNHSSPCLVVYPELHVGTVNDTVGYINSYSAYITEGMTLETMTDKKSRNFWTFDPVTNTLQLEPVIFSPDIHVSDVGREIRILLNNNTRVIVREPVYHEFDNSFSYCSNNFLRLAEKFR